MVLESGHPNRRAAVLVLALFLCISSLPTALTQPAPAPALPVPSATVLAGCSYFSSLRFTNDVPQYITANPQYQALNFTRSTCIKGGTGNVFNHPLPKNIPPLFFMRGTTITIRTVCSMPECTLILGRNPVAVHDPTSSSVADLQITSINSTSVRITIPANAGIGRYSFLGNILVSGEGAPCQLLDPFSAWFWVIYNASPGSPDTDVNGLNAAQFSAYVMGQTDVAYFQQSSAATATNTVKTVTNRYMGGPITFTLGPQKAVVYLAAMNLVDNARAWNTANSSVTAISRGASNGLPSGWPVPAGKSLIYDVPLLLTRLQNPSTAATVCGQCMVYGAIGDAFSRSIGVPARMATTINSMAVGVLPAAKADSPPAAWTWNFHVWDEVWLNRVTNMAWSAFDPSKGNAFGTTPINPIGPIPTNAMAASATPATSFALRFGTGALPGAAAGACPCSSTAFVTDPSGSRTTVTAAYRSPLPDPGPITSPVSVSFDRMAYVFGDHVIVSVTVTNPLSSGVFASAEVSLNAADFEGVNLGGPWPVATVDRVFEIPANGATTQTFEFSSAQYQANGDFVALASVNLGASVVSGYNYTTVTSGLSVQLAAPQTVQIGQRFNTTVQVTNDLSTSVSDPAVSVFLPEGLAATAPTDLTIPFLAPGETDTFVIPTQASLADLYVLSAETSSPSGGFSSSSPVTVNATTDQTGPVPHDDRALIQPASPIDATTSISGTTSATCSTTSTTVQTVPEFPGTASPLIAAAGLFLLAALGLVLRTTGAPAKKGG